MSYSTEPLQYPVFPTTLDAVTNGILNSFTTTNDDDDDQGKSEAGTGSGRIVNRNGIMGRMGVDIQGAAALLLPNGHLSSEEEEESTALRVLGLVLAAKLAANRRTENQNNTIPSLIPSPVALYLNSLQHTLCARHELTWVQDQFPHLFPKQEQQGEEPFIILKCLTQDPHLPSCMKMKPSSSLSSSSSSSFSDDEQETKVDPRISTTASPGETTITKRRKRKRRSSSSFPLPLDPDRGVCIVIQPTDYHDSSYGSNYFDTTTPYTPRHVHHTHITRTMIRPPPPGPALGITVTALQTLCAKAHLQGIPVLLIAPRFIQPKRLTSLYSDQDYAHENHDKASRHTSHIQRVPWILRDFIPAQYHWIAATHVSAPPPLSASREPPKEIVGVGLTSEATSLLLLPQQQQQQQQQRVNLAVSAAPAAAAAATHAPTPTTSPISGPIWHVFARRSFKPPAQSAVGPLQSSYCQSQNQYQYLASVWGGSGRPNQALVERIVAEFSTT